MELGYTTPKVKNRVMYKNIDKGGLKLINVEHQIKSLILNWVKRVFACDEAKWMKMFQLFFNEVDLKDLLISRCSLNATNHLPLFYQCLLKSWCEFRSLFSPETAEHVRKEMLWFNPFITRDSNSVFF